MHNEKEDTEQTQGFKWSSPYLKENTCFLSEINIFNWIFSTPARVLVASFWSMTAPSFGCRVVPPLASSALSYTQAACLGRCSLVCGVVCTWALANITMDMTLMPRPCRFWHMSDPIPTYHDVNHQPVAGIYLILCVISRGTDIHHHKNNAIHWICTQDFNSLRLDFTKSFQLCKPSILIDWLSCVFCQFLRRSWFCHQTWSSLMASISYGRLKVRGQNGQKGMNIHTLTRFFDR